MSLPRVGARLLRKYEALPPEARVADVIATCYSDPALFPAARFAAEVTELSRRDTLDYADAALLGSIRTLTAESFRRRAWRDAARITAPTLVIYGSHDRLVDPRMAGRAARAFADGQDRGAAPHRPRGAHGASRPGGRRDRRARRAACGNSRLRRPVDRGTGRDASPRPFSKKDFWRQSCRCPLWSSPPKR